MAKIKIKPNATKTIQMIIFLMRGQETLDSTKDMYETNSDIIEFREIQQKCAEFLQSKNITYQINIYAPNLDNLQQQVKLEPSHYFVVEELIQKMNSTLILIIKSVYQELREDFQAQIDQLKQQFTLLRQMIEELRPIKQNIEFLRKTSVTGMPLMLPAQSMIQKDYQHLQLDIAVLFSEPLYDDEKKKPTPPAVDFRSQISRLNIALQSSFKPSVIMRCQIATLQSLKNIIKYSKPKILHIVCHGNSEGFLEFQDDSRNTLGVLQLVKPEDIKNSLKNLIQLLPQLVFVNSCHSQSIGKAFFDIGVKNVIGINSQDLIIDEAAQIFSQNFYRNIFKGQSVMQSFNSAKTRVQVYHVGGCCCNHSAFEPHRQNCKWLKLQKKIPTAHKDYHVPSNKCECKLRNFNRHNATCQWARKVLFQINEDFRIPVEEGSSQYRFPCHISEFPEYFDRQKKQLVICCCPAKGRKPHSQSNKFIIMAKDQGRQPLFNILHNRVKPQITDLTPIQLLQAHEKSKAAFGRQRQLFEFFKIIKQVNFMVVYGKTGTGLTNFSVKASTYMMERRIFTFFFFIDLYDIKDQVVFRYKFNQITKFQYNGKTIDQIGMRNKKILLLFDNCDDFINGSPNEFYNQIQTILRQMPKCKIIITFKQETNKIFDQKKILCRKFELCPFQTRYAIAFLNSRLKDKTDISVGYQQFRKLINEYPVLKIPKVIQSLSQSISDSAKKIKYEQIEKNVKGIQISDTNKLTQQVLTQLKQKSVEAFQFLIFVSQFSDGVTFEDLNIFSLYAHKDMTVSLPVKKNWQDHYLMLFEKQSNQDVQQKLESQYPKLVSTVSHVQNPSIFYETEKSNLDMKKKVSEAATSTDNNAKNQLDEIKSQSYFVDKSGKGRFIVKRFIRDFVWNKYENQTTFQMKFLYVTYFSVILEMLFTILVQEKYIHEDLMTYSAVSSSGIFSFSTTLGNIYGKRDLTKSTRVAKTFLSDFDSVFMKNQQLIDKIKSTDPSTFIMNHRHDFLKVYDYKWSDVFNFFQSRKKEQQKVFIVLLSNLLVYIPTALKIAKAEDSLLRYVLRGSNKQLVKIRVVSRPDISLKNELKITFIQIGLNLEDKKQLDESINKANDVIEQFKAKIGRSAEFQDIYKIYNQEKLTIQLLRDLSSIKSLSANDITHLKTRQKQFYKGNDNFNLNPLIKAKQALLLSLIFLKFLKKNQAQKKIILKSQEGQQLKNWLQQLCMKAGEIFGDLNCIKLKLKANLTSLQLTWDLNEKFESNLQSNPDIDRCLQKIIDCQKMYLDNENRLRGFTQFDNKIKELKQQIKGKLWRSAAKRIIFMKAFPLSSKENYPIIKNLVRKKNNFRKQIQKIFKQPKFQNNVVSQRKISGMGSPALKSKDTRSHSIEKKSNLDISTKFQVLTEQKIQEEAKARCSIMYLTVDVKVQNEKVFFICENQLMGEQLAQIDENFAQVFNFQNILILIMAGSHTVKALSQISKLSARPPIIIALNSDPIEHYDDVDYSHEFDADSLRQIIRKENQIKQSELIYTKCFINNIITQTEIVNNSQILQIHKKSEQKLRSLGSKRVKAIIELSTCSKDIYLKYNLGIYRDLSPGYEKNHNIDQKYYENNVLIRRWRKMTEFFKYIHGHKIRIVNSSSQAEENSDIFQSIFVDEANWRPNQATSYINIFGENGCGKTSFIRQIAKILVERQFYDFGVFLFEGKKIQNHFGGDFEAYIKKQASSSRMPVLQDFHRLLSQKTILIVDDFNMIKPRVNARMKIFMDKIMAKKVNLILVSVNELKLQFLPKMKKIKLEPLDDFQTQVLAYNILNINNPEQIIAFNKLKQNNKKRNRPLLIRQIDDCKRARPSQLQVQDIDNIQESEQQMKKSNTTLG